MFNHNISKAAPFPTLAVLAGLFLVASTDPSWSASSLGEMFCNAFNNAKPFGKLFQWVAYVAGAFAALQGIHHFRLHTDAPHNNPVHRAVLLWVGAACLLALPNVVGAVIIGIYGAAGAGGSLACTAGSSGGGGAGLDAMLSGFVGNIKGPLVSVSSLVAILCGVFMMVRGLMKASKYGFDPRANSIHSVLTHIGFGALLLTIGTNLNMMMASLFGSSGVSSSSVLNWSHLSALAGGVSTQFQTAVVAGLTFVQIIGVIAFVRGWLIMKKVVEGAGNVTLGAGLTHILGGVLAINIFQFLIIMDKTFGTNLIS